MTVSIYVGLTGLLYVVASLAVIRLRRRHLIGYGNGGNEDLRRWTAAHSNFAAYAPFSLFMLYLLEQSAASSVEIHIYGSLLVLGRFMHLVGVGFFEKRKKFLGRMLGMMLTLFPIIGLSLRLIFLKL